MTAPQPIEPGHLYMFVGWMKAQRANASGHGGLAACRWLNADGVAVGYHEFLSGYAHVDWQNHLHLTETPLNARWCKFMLLNNDPANRIWFDDLMLMDINSVVKAAP